MTMSCKPNHLLCEAVYSDISYRLENILTMVIVFQAGYQKVILLKEVFDGDTDTKTELVH